MKLIIEKFYGENPINSKDYPRIINEKHFDRLVEFLKDGSIYTGGETKKEELYIEPTLLEDVSINSNVMKEEIFGPILPIIEYENIKEVVSFIKEDHKPLPLYLFSNDKKNQRIILIDISFGGIGQSGLGFIMERLALKYLPMKKAY